MSTVHYLYPRNMVL